MDPASPCLNCGDPTPGRYCPSCGQQKTGVRVSIRAMLAEALEDELSLDRRLPATLGALFLDPGQLTAEYVNGRIARYVRPFRLYLVSSVIFFLLLSITSLRFLRETMPGDFRVAPPAATDTLPAQHTVPLADMQGELERVNAELERVTAELGSPDLSPTLRDSLRSERHSLVRRRAALEARGAPPMAPAPRDTGPDTSPAVAGSPPRSDLTEFLGDARVNLGHPALNAAANAKIQSLAHMTPREAIERLASDFLRYIPTVLFILLPLFAGVLKLLYIRRGRYYAEHFIYLLHTHAFVFLLFTMLLVLVMVGLFRWWVVPVLFTWLLAYTYLALRRVYGQGWLKTLVKWWILGWTYFWFLGFAVPAAFLVTALLA
jgi:hypothetical protein